MTVITPKETIKNIFTEDIIRKNSREAIKTIFTENITREGSDRLFSWLSDSDFFTAPASTRFHGAHEGGLAEHSLNVYWNLNKLIGGEEPTFSQFYGKYTKETIALVTLMHDICKVNFYAKEWRNKKNEETGQWEKVEAYTYNDMVPLGHGEKSVIILQSFIKMTADEIYAIRWHMGGFDCAVKGGDQSASKAYEKCPLAVALHLADTAATYFDEAR